MIDFHSHILPGMDDGSRDVDESLQLLRMLSDQGADRVAATPHFYADSEPVPAFLERRQKAYRLLLRQMFDDAPAISLGAEVRYYPGISRLEDLKELRLGNTRFLLLEMPLSVWSEYTVRELIDLSCSKDLLLVLAHIERYMHYQSESVWQSLLESGILMQVNASFFLRLRSRRTAISMLKNHSIHFLGSDCHNVSARPPYLGRAVEVIRKKLGDDFIKYMTDSQATLWRNSVNNPSKNDSN